MQVGNTRQGKNSTGGGNAIFARCPSPSLLLLLPQDPEAALWTLLWGGGRLTEKPRRESLSDECDEGSQGGLALPISCCRARVRACVHPKTTLISGPQAPERPDPCCRNPPLPGWGLSSVNCQRVTKPFLFLICLITSLDIEFIFREQH